MKSVVFRSRLAKVPLCFSVFTATAVLLCFLAFAAQPCAAAPSLALQSFSVEVSSKNTLVLHSGLRIDNSTEVANLLRDGGHLLLACTVQVDQVRTFFSNARLAEANTVWHLRNDPLTRDFLMYRDHDIYRGKQLASLVASTWEHTALQIPLDEPLLPNETYRVTLTFSLRYAEVPPWLAKALYFWSWDVVPTVTYTQEFTF